VLASLLLLALQPAAATEPPAPAPHTAAFSALERCADSRSQQACLEAETALKALIVDQEREEERQKHPRCLGALTRLEAVLAVYRWRLENTGNLQSTIQAAAQQCPAPSTGLSQ
jgi:hypothetical protein